MKKEKYVIIARYVADTYAGLIEVKNKVQIFESEDAARDFGIKNLNATKYIASWQAISIKEAKKKGYNI